MLIILSIGVTRETVVGLLKHIANGGSVEGIVAETTPGYEDAKKPIVEGIRTTAELLDARFCYIIVGFGDEHASSRIYRVLREIGSRQVYASFITGSRYLIPILMQALLRYSHDTGAEVYAVHGIEGEKYFITPLTGYTVYKLDRTQKRIFKLIYMYPGDELRTVEDLIEKYSLGKSVYKVLRGLERKGLIIHRRNRVVKTFPGKLLYNLLREAGEL